MPASTWRFTNTAAFAEEVLALGKRALHESVCLFEGLVMTCSHILIGSEIVTDHAEYLCLSAATCQR
jgi:hypothetical protein